MSIQKYIITLSKKALQSGTLFIFYPKDNIKLLLGFIAQSVFSLYICYWSWSIFSVYTSFVW